MLYRVAGYLLGSLCCHALFAADTPQYGPAPSWVHPAAAQIAAPATEASTRIISLDRQYNFDSSGDEGYLAQTIRIQTPEGLTAMGTVTLPWNPDTDTLTIHKLLIHRGDQTIDVLAGGQKFTVLRRENKLEYATLDGVLTAVIQPPGLQVNDILELAFTLKRSDPVLHGVSEWFESGWPPLPIANLNIRARWPTSSNIRWQASTQLKGLTTVREGDHTVVSLVAKDFQPPVLPKSSPTRFQIGNELEFTGFGSWSDVAKLMAPLYEQAQKLDAQSPLRAQIELIRNISPDATVRAAAALRLVQDQVRYVFLGMDDGGLLPASADATWTRRFGDCKGKTVLLLALLHGVGIDAEPVAVNTKIGDAVASWLPVIQLFDHVMVRARIGGKVYWLDGARGGDRVLEKIIVPYYHWGLPLTRNSTQLVAMVPAPLAEPQVAVDVRIDATAGIDKPALFHAQSVYRGDLAQAMKAPFANLTPDNLDKTLRDFWIKQFPSIQVKSATASFDDSSGVETLAMEGSSPLDWNQNHYRVDVMQLGGEADLSRNSGPDQDVPFAVAFPSFFQVKETILLPGGGTGFTLGGTDVDQIAAGVHFQRHATLQDGVFSAQLETLAVQPEFPAGEAAAAQKTLHDMRWNVVYLAAPGKGAAVSDLPRIGPLYTGPEQEHLRRGIAFEQNDQLDKAVGEFTQVLLVAPFNGNAIERRGFDYSRLQKFTEARADLELALELNSQSAIALRGLAYVDAMQGHPQAAIESLDKLLVVNPAAADDTLSLRAGDYMQIGKYDLALADLTTVQRDKPDNYNVYGSVARIFRLQGRHDLALAEAQAALDAGAKDASDNKGHAFAAAAAIYGRSGDLAASQHAWDQAVALKPDMDLLLTRIRFRLASDTAGKRADIEAALKVDPKSAVAKSSLADVQVAAGDFAGAVATLSSMLEANPDLPEILNKRGIAHLRNGEARLADLDFSQAQQLAKEQAVLNNMCWALATANLELQRALTECNTANALSPGDRNNLDSKAFVLLRLGQLDDAIAAYDQGLKIDALSPSSLYGRGIAKRRKGDAGADADINLAKAVDFLVEDEFRSFGIAP